jgi:hypothetical protein
MTATIAPSYPFLATDGQDFAPLPAASECTVAQAAQLLDGTELYVNELLEDERIAFRVENGECLIQWESLLKFEQEQRRGRKILDEMIQLDQEMGLYDD